MQVGDWREYHRDGILEKFMDEGIPIESREKSSCEGIGGFRAKTYAWLVGISRKGGEAS